MTLNVKFDHGTKVYYPEEKIAVTCYPVSSEIIKVKEISINVICLLIKGPNESLPSNHLSFAEMRSLGAITAREISINTKDFPKQIDDKFVFSFDFNIPQDKETIETFHGTHVYSEYFVTFDIKQGFLKQDIFQSETFTIYMKPMEVRPSGPSIDEVIDYCDPDSPAVDFKCRVYIDTPIVSPRKPPKGFVCVEKTSETIQQISITFLVIETIVNENRKMNIYQTETNWTNVAEKNPLINREIPFFVEWERMKVSQTFSSQSFMFNIGYALRIKIKWEFGASATYDIPLVLYRDLKY